MERDLNEFNLAFAWLNRLNMLFLIADESSVTLDAFKWYHALMAIFREISTEMKPEEKIKYIKDFQNLYHEINIIVAKQNVMGGTYMPIELHRKLMNIEMNLRMIMKESGLQNKMQESAMNAFK